MIELKPIITIQKEYLDLLSKSVGSLTEESTHIELTYFFEEVSLFWRRKYEIVDFFLRKIDTNDKTSFLAGAMYIDLTNDGHYEFAPCGKYRLFTDPVSKMRAFFSTESSVVKQKSARDYLFKVVKDCINVLSNYSDYFIVLPLNDVFSEEQEDRMAFLTGSSYSFVSSLFVSPCATEEVFLNRYHSFQEIEQDIRPDLLDKLILNDTSDVSISLQERIEKNLDNILSIDTLRQSMGDAEIFLMSIGQYFMQVLDIILIAYSYKLIPFIRSDVVFNYLLLTYPVFSDDKVVVAILEQTTVAYIFQKMYGNHDFSSIAFSDFYSHVSENRIIDSVIAKSRSRKDSLFKLQISDIASLMEEECSQFLPT